MASSSSMRRLRRELEDLSKNQSPDFTAAPVNDDLFEWHFTLRGPRDSDFAGGLYHGRIVLPVNYPLSPPSIMMLNPNGRFETGKKICLSMSNYHPELWQPAWDIRTMLEALRSFFPSPADGAIAGLDWPRDVRQKIAREETHQWHCAVCAAKLCEIIEPEDIEPPSLETPLPSLPSPRLAAQEDADPQQGDVAVPTAGPEGASPSPVVSASASPPSAPRPDPGLALPASPVPIAEALRPPSLPAQPETPAAAPAELPEPAPAPDPAPVPAPAPTPAPAPAPRVQVERRRAPQDQPPIFIQLLKFPTSANDWLVWVLDMLLLFLIGGGLSLLADMLAFPPDIRHLDADDGL